MKTTPILPMSLRSIGLSLLAASGKRHARTTTPIMSNKKLSSPARDKKAKNLCIVDAQTITANFSFLIFFIKIFNS